MTGFPNLFSVISAFNDIFVINVGMTQERSEISLQPNCEREFEHKIDINKAWNLRMCFYLFSSSVNLTSSMNRSGLFGSLKSQASKQKTPRPSRLPLSENNNSRSYSLQGPPPKTRALSTANENNNYQMAPNYKGKVASAAIFQPAAKIQRSTAVKSKPLPLQIQQPTQSQQHQQQQLQQVIQAQQQKQNLGYESRNFTAVDTYMSYNGNASIYSVASNNSSLNTSASSSAHNNDNSFNSSLSLSDLNGSRTQLSLQAPITTASNTYMSGTTRLWDRRDAATMAAAAAASMSYQQQAMLTENVSGLPPLIMSTSEHQLQQQQHFQTAMEQSMAAVQAKIKQEPTLYADHTNLHIYPMFEPPKPDTPPSNVSAFYFYGTINILVGIY